MSLKIAFLLRRIGPYHHARLKMAAEKVHLSVVETRPSSQEYAWEFFPEDRAYSRLTLGMPPDPEKGFTGKILARKIADVLHQIKPDVVVTTGWADQEYHAAVLWAMQHGVARVLISDSTAGDVRRYPLLEWIKRQLLMNYQAALVAGSRSRKYLLQLGFRDEDIFQPWDVVDNDYFTTAAEKSRSSPSPYADPYFLCVSRFIQVKNIPGLIRAFHSFLEETGSNHRLIVLGSGELADEVNATINELRLDERVLVPGFTQLEGLPFYYAHAEALILPSFSDTWGLVVNEAMASGLPVLVSENCGCTDDLVKESENGFVFNPANQEDIKNCLVKFTRLSNEERNKMGSRGKEILRGFRIEDLAVALEAALKKAEGAGSAETVISRIVLRTLTIVNTRGKV